MIDGLAFDLLGGHVRERPENGALIGERRRLRQRIAHSGDRPSRPQLRQTEIEELDPRRGQHDVPRLQITMDDPGAMGLVERVGDLERVPDEPVDRQSAALQPLRERLTFQILHDEIVGAVLMPDVMERADVRVLERRQLGLNEVYKIPEEA